MIKDIENLKKEELKYVQATITALHLIGLSDEMIEKLPFVLSNFDKIVDVLNKHSEDLTAIQNEVTHTGNIKAQQEVQKILKGLVEQPKGINSDD